MTSAWRKPIDLDTEILVDMPDDERAKLHAALVRAVRDSGPELP